MRAFTLIASTLTLALIACDGGSESNKPTDSEEETRPTEPTDNDADGDGVSPDDGDCNDADPAIYPGAEEACDEVDNNCNGQTDEGLPDTDGDGTPDCKATESCDGKDNDGDGQIDEDFADADGDGVVDCLGTESCDGQDNDGDGQVDEGYDADGDGYTTCGTDEVEGDCDDGDPAIHPGARDVDGDSVDNDCDGLTDEDAYAEGDLAITEIMANPSFTADPDGEWFELRNTSGRPLVLNGFTIASGTGEEHQIVSDDLISVEPNEFIVIGGNTNMSTNGQVDVAYAYSDILLSNEADELEIWAGDVMVDSVTWDDGATMPDVNGASMMIDEAYYGADLNDDASYWCWSIEPWTDVNADDGSPGTGNGLCGSWDHDGDTWTAVDGDCDDTDTSVYPGAPELSLDKDYNCDGRFERTPFADADAIGTFESCSEVALDASGSYDPEGGSLSYSWELVSAPASSALTTADLTNATSAIATFNPDFAGDYVAMVTVSDGYSSSNASVSITITERPGNFAPIADAGIDQSYSSTATCTPISYGVSYECADCTTEIYFFLDAAASVDPNGDDMTYSWSVVSGSSYATASSTGDTTSQVLVGNVPATYGAVTNTDVVVELTATDCMGATGTDQVTLTYSCTGS